MLLMRTHGLTALNTWSNSIPASTFKWGRAETQSDFIMVRQRDASVQAKTALRTCHVGASRHTGAIHFPVLACLSLRKPYWLHHRPHAAHVVDREALLRAIDHPQLPDHAAKLAVIRTEVSAYTTQSRGLQGIEGLHQTLQQACARVFLLKLSQNPGRPQRSKLVSRPCGTSGEPSEGSGKMDCVDGSQPGRLGRTSTPSINTIRLAAVRLGAMSCCKPWMKPRPALTNTTLVGSIMQIIRRIAPKQARQRLQIRDISGWSGSHACTHCGG